MAANSASTSSFVQSFPPRIEPQYVRIIGDSVGVVNLTPAALQCLADKLTQVLHRCSVMARKVAMHSRRRTVRVEDVQHALNVLNMQMPIGVATRALPSMRPLRMPGGEQMFVREDSDVDLVSVAQGVQSRIPVKRHYRVHWIRLDDEEEPPQEKKAKKTNQEGHLSSSDLPAALRKRVTLPAELAAPSVSFRIAAQGVPKKEQILIKPSFLEPLSVAFMSATQNRAGELEMESSESMPLLEYHRLCRIWVYERLLELSNLELREDLLPWEEQQIYLKEIVEACVGQDDRKRQQALQSLERDTGIQELLPRLSRLIHMSIRCNIVHRCLSMLIYVVRMIRSIAVNKSVKLDGVLHEFLPSLMSCMLGRVLCTRPDSDNHWALRDFAGKTLITIIKDHGTKETKRRSFRAVKRIFDEPSSSYSMIYGTITTLLEFASPVELIRLHPRIMVLLERTRLTGTTSADQLERTEAQKLHAALLKHESALRRLIKQAAQSSRKDQH